jgi:lipopolysaccharide heptosyltransferase I
MLDTGNDPRILVCRLSHIGDCVLTLPMIHELRRGFPGAQISWAMERPSHKLLGGHSAINEVLLVPRGWMKSAGAIRDLHRELKRRRFDVAIDPQSIMKSALLGRLSGAKTRIGFGGIHGRELSPLFNNCRIHPQSTHLVDRSLELIRPLVPDARFRKFGLPVAPEAAASIAGFLESRLDGRPFVVINPGASWPSKRWENDRFAALACALAHEPGIISLITWAGSDEQAMADAIVESSAGCAVKAPATTLPELAALLQAAVLFIGCDTGPLHIAAAVGTPCTGLYGPTRPVDSGAYGDQHVALQVRYHAGGCRQRRQAANDAMRAISTEMVIEAVRQQLQRVRNRQARAEAA